MDYSAISQDPAGTSPWASPRPTQTTFPPSSTNDILSEPLAPPPYDADRESQPESALPTGEEQTESPDLSERLQSAQLGDPDYQTEQSQYAAQQQQYAQQPSSQLPARYQTGPRQHARPAPLYKIQAKITSLERTGKKDPILRFDVHVSKLLIRWLSTVIATNPPMHRPTSPNSEPLNIARSVVPMQNLLSSPNI